MKKKINPATKKMATELAKPTHCCKDDLSKLRESGLDLVEKMQAQAARYLRLHGQMIDEETDGRVLAIQTQLRQTYLAFQRKANQLGDDLHGLFEIFAQVERKAALLEQVLAEPEPPEDAKPA